MTTPHPSERSAQQTQEMPAVSRSGEPRHEAAARTPGDGNRRPAAAATGTGWAESHDGEHADDRRPGPAAPGRGPVAVSAPTGAVGEPRSRRARLLVSKIDPWSVMKLGFLLSIALGIILVVAVAVLWSVLQGMGVFDSVNRVVDQVATTENGPGFNLLDYAGLSRVLGITTMVALVNVVLITALSTLGAFLYNLASSLVGGLHVTLTEDS